ncbi:MAG: hypothetical protein WCE62_19765 [Polyangiales bacterium]
MWMQLLEAAGFPPIGSAFPRNWESTIKDANPAGFYESELRGGIFYATNPHPKTGVYLFPEDTRRHAVKVFIPGLIKTDRAFIDKVIATIRPWRQYVHSLNRLYEMEREAKVQRNAPDDVPGPVVMPPLIEWWVENFSLISDIVTRRHPFFMVAYESVLEDPEKALRPVFRWIGEGNVDAAIAAVHPELRTQNEELDDPTEISDFELEPEAVEVFDALYETVRTQSPLQQAFVDRLNETNRLLRPRIEPVVKETARAQVERRRLLQARRKAGEDAEPGS